MLQEGPDKPNQSMLDAATPIGLAASFPSPYVLFGVPYLGAAHFSGFPLYML